MPSWMKMKVQGDNQVIELVIKRFFIDQKNGKINSRVYIDRHIDGSLEIKTRASFGTNSLDDSMKLIEKASQKFPMAVILVDIENEEARYSGFAGYTSVVVDGETIIWRGFAGSDKSPSFTLNRHIHEYDKSGNPSRTCLSQHYGYIYSITNREMNVEYVGQHQIKAGESWADYFGSSTRLKQTIKETGRKGFEKKLIAFADDEADLILQEIRAISNLMYSQPERCQNNTIGGCDITRAMVYEKVFNSVDDYTGNDRDSKIKRVSMFLNSISPYEYDHLRQEIKEFVDPPWRNPSVEVQNHLGLDDSGLRRVEEGGVVMFQEIKMKKPARSIEILSDDFRKKWLSGDLDL